MNVEPQCHHCQSTLNATLVDLGKMPPSNAYLLPDQDRSTEKHYPLHARVCENCWLVQVDVTVPPDEIFNSEYSYFSSYSKSWLAHCSAYVDKISEKLNLDSDSFVIEIASNDGSLLRNFVDRGIPSLGIEPTANTAEFAKRHFGVESLVDFFTEKLAKQLREERQAPDLVCCSNVMAHVPNINDFVRGVAVMLDGDAVFTVEFPHLLNIIKFSQFDTIYHEHYFYHSLLCVEKIFAQFGLRVFDIDELSVHGGTLRVYACKEASSHTPTASVDKIRREEKEARLDSLDGYRSFAGKVQETRRALREFLSQVKRDGQRVVAYGAAAKGNTLLNYCDLGIDDFEYCVDLNPVKQNKLLPGTHIPIYSVDKLLADTPDYVLILPWNIAPEIVNQLSDLSDRGVQFLKAVPTLEVVA